MLGIDHPLYYFFFFFLLVVSASPLIFRALPVTVKTNDVDKNLKLEGLRGLLAPTVFFHHALITFYFYRDQKWASPPSGFFEKLGSGPVLLFFFITGYLFWEQNKRQTYNFSSVSFLKKRVRRILPAYLFSLAIIIILVFYFTRNSPMAPVSANLIGILSWLTFGLPFGNFNSINNYSETHLINASVAWTLRFEWLFYFSFLFIRKLSKPKMFIIFIGILLILKRFLGLSYFNNLDPEMTLAISVVKLINEFSYFMVIGFAFGIFTSFLNTPKSQMIIKKSVFTLLGGVSLAVYMFCDPIKAYSLEGSFLLFIFFISIILNKEKRHLLHWNGFQALGHISYSVYLLHGVGLFVGFKMISTYTSILNMNPNLFWMIIYGIGIFVLMASTISYRFIEYPFMIQRKKSLT